MKNIIYILLSILALILGLSIYAGYKVCTKELDDEMEEVNGI
jgi:uncharacterized protein YneF (UPF0154 family)